MVTILNGDAITPQKSTFAQRRFACPCELILFIYVIRLAGARARGVAIVEEDSDSELLTSRVTCHVW